MARVLVVSPEPVRARMAGMGFRALRVAETLRRDGHDVFLAAPEGSESSAVRGPALVPSGARGFAAAARDADVAIVSGHAGQRLLERGFPGALVADLYDPFFVENAAYAASLGPAVFENDRRVLFALLDRADLVLAATEEQRLFYLGLLLGRSRLAPSDLAGDPEARGVVAVAPFGVDALPPEAPPPVGADVLFGGVYDWYDPAVVLDAWPHVLAAVPGARLLLFENPNPSTTPQTRLAETVARARDAGWLGTSVLLRPWVAADARADLYASCRVAALAHAPSLETSLSFRTRVLDFLWGGLPVVATRGGAASALLERTGAGILADASPRDFAAALARMLRDDALRSAASRAARAAAAGFAWEAALRPLRDFVSAPRRRAPAPPRRRPLHAARRVVARLSGDPA